MQISRKTGLGRNSSRLSTIWSNSLCFGCFRKLKSPHCVQQYPFQFLENWLPKVMKEALELLFSPSLHGHNCKKKRVKKSEILSISQTLQTDWWRGRSFFSFLRKKVHKQQICLRNTTRTISDRHFNEILWAIHKRKYSLNSSLIVIKRAWHFYIFPNFLLERPKLKYSDC